MSYALLAPNLHSTAAAAEKYFAAELGAKSFHREEPIDDSLPLRPTLRASLNNGHLLCVEVSESAYSNSLDTFVVECSTKCFPVKLYVAIPSAKGDVDFAANLKKAKERGVGIVELSDSHFLANDAVSLSLFGLRRIELKDFPKTKREAVKQAEQTFLNGNPVKGCQALYEELEAVTRAFAQRSLAEGWWRAPHGGETAPHVKLDTGPWALVLEELTRFLELTSCKAKCPLLKPSHIAGVRGLTDLRNLTSHKPNKIDTIIRRDKQLRTCFESTSDLLKDWYKITKPLRL